MIRRFLSSFMYGRYGARGFDKLNIVLLVSSFVIYFVNMFVPNAVFTLIAGILSTLLLFFYLFRSFSRNHAARLKENAAFCKFFRKIKSFFKLQYDRIKDFKKYRYKTCPNCKAVLRLPAKKGDHTVVCPKCKNRFNVKNLF